MASSLGPTCPSCGNAHDVRAVSEIVTAKTPKEQQKKALILRRAFRKQKIHVRWGSNELALDVVTRETRSYIPVWWRGRKKALEVLRRPHGNFLLPRWQENTWYLPIPGIDEVHLIPIKRVVADSTPLIRSFLPPRRPSPPSAAVSAVVLSLIISMSLGLDDFLLVQPWPHLARLDGLLLPGTAVLVSTVLAWLLGRYLQRRMVRSRRTRHQADVASWERQKSQWMIRYAELYAVGFYCGHCDRVFTPIRVMCRSNPKAQATSRIDKLVNMRRSPKRSFYRKEEHLKITRWISMGGRRSQSFLLANYVQMLQHENSSRSVRLYE